MSNVADIWTEKTSVLLASFWGWDPEEWGMVPWTFEGDREKKIEELSDPFVCVVYVTNNSEAPQDEKEKICGFYLVSHKRGHRNKFSHPKMHGYLPKKWKYALKASRAFTFLPEYRLIGKEVFREISREAQNIGRRGVLITDSRKIKKLQECPWEEVDMYLPPTGIGNFPTPESSAFGMVRSGPAASRGYAISDGVKNLPRELYILHLKGDTDAYLGRPAKGVSIYKIGLSYSPESRRRDFQKAMPHGAFHWQIKRTTRQDGDKPYINHSVAEVGEYAMKEYLAQNAEHLGGEFYLATEKQIEAAWIAGRNAAKNHKA